MIINGSSLLDASPIKDMISDKRSGPGGVSYGLGEAGYDIRIKQNIHFSSRTEKRVIYIGDCFTGEPITVSGRFALASAMDEFQMPEDLCGIVHDKSTWARRGLSVFNTVIEPGFHGGLTLELVYHGEGELVIPAGAGIAQVIFHRTAQHAAYDGKYQNQSTDPEPARDSV